MAMAVTEDNAIIPVAPYTMAVYDGKIENFLKSGSAHSDKLSAAIQLFLDQPYFLEPLGEGPEGRYSQEPLYRTDQFDCVTFVDTVLALLYSHSFAEFRQNMQRARYLDARIDYTARTDWFTDLEWIPNLERLGWIKDVTWTIQDPQAQPIAKTAETLIDKPNWYQVRPLKMLHRLSPVPEGHAAEKLLQALRAESKRFSEQPSVLTYLPLDALFDADHRPVQALFDQIPSVSVIAIVRPDWAIRNHFPGFPQGYGSNLNVSHLGIAIRSPDGLMFYNASSLHAKVTAEPLVHYLEKYLDSPTIKGIHVEEIIAAQ